MDLKDPALIDLDNHWNCQSKRSVLRLARGTWSTSVRPLVDVGTGTAIVPAAVATFASDGEVAGADPADQPEWAEQQGRLRFADSVQPDDGAKAILMVCVDVLEHVQDDVMLLTGDLSIASPATVVLIAAPPRKFLRCTDDEMVGAGRPCRLGQVRRSDERVGLRAVDRQYLFASTVVAVWAARRGRRGRATIDVASVPSGRDAATTRVISVDHRSSGAFVVASTPASPATPGVACTRSRPRGRAA